MRKGIALIACGLVLILIGQAGPALLGASPGADPGAWIESRTEDGRPCFRLASPLDGSVDGQEWPDGPASAEIRMDRDGYLVVLKDGTGADLRNPGPSPIASEAAIIRPGADVLIAAAPMEAGGAGIRIAPEGTAAMAAAFDGGGRLEIRFPGGDVYAFDIPPSDGHAGAAARMAAIGGAADGGP